MKSSGENSAMMSFEQNRLDGIAKICESFRRTATDAVKRRIDELEIVARDESWDLNKLGVIILATKLLNAADDTLRKLPEIPPVAYELDGTPQPSRKIVYFIRCGHGPIKIGRTSGSVTKRLSQLQTSSSDQLEVIGTIEEANGISEGAIHRMFSGYHIRGEWFQPAREILDFIERNCSVVVK